MTYRNSQHIFHLDEKKGIKKSEKRVVVDLLNKYKRLHNLTVFEPPDPALMSRQEQYRAIQAINIIKERQYGNIKGRTWSDGSPQQNYIPCKELMLPIIALEALF